MDGKAVFARIVGALMTVVAASAPLAAQDDTWPWPPISREELDLKDCPQQPGAPAIYLMREEVSDLEKFESRIFRRIKVLTEAGRDRANIEIPFLKGVSKIVGIEARVFHPSSAAPRIFDGKVFEKTAFRTRRARITVKTFALPDVDVGCIIEYRYKSVVDRDGSGGGEDDILEALQIGGGKPIEGSVGEGMKRLSFSAAEWEIQRDVFTRRAKFVFIPSSREGLMMEYFFDGPGALMWFGQRTPPIKPEWKDRKFELEVENIPPFEAEELMTPEDSEKMVVHLVYCAAEVKDQDGYWRKECENWQKAAEGFIGKPDKLVPEAHKLVEGIDDPVEKLKRLYERAQGIRNLSYEKYLSPKERKAQKLKDNTKVADVWQRGYGYRSDITRSFIALARAAGFEAEAVRVSTRDDKLFMIMNPSFNAQLDSELAKVKVGDRELLFDPATPFCPFSLVHWSRSNATAVRYSQSPPAFFTTSVYPPDLALTQREIALRLSPEGDLAGTVKTTYTGHEALIRRLEYRHSDETDKKEGFERELAGVLPAGSTVTMKRLENIDNSSPALVIEYEVALPGLGTAAGERMLLPASPLLGSDQYPFRHSQRKYPVYFPFPFREFNDIVITLPEGMTVETRPEPRKNERDNFFYSLVCQQETPQKLHVQRDLVVKKCFHPANQYKAVKDFYDAVRSNDEEQLVLTKEKK
jgi:hypothetical protein